MEDKTYLNLQQAVERNKEDIERLQNYGVKIDRFLVDITDIQPYLTEENVGKYYYIGNIDKVYTITKRANGGLIAIAIDVKGIQGEQGIQGEKGDKGDRAPGIFGVTTNPGQLSEHYIENDMYITSDGALHKYKNKKWIKMTDLKGEMGPEGPVGSNEVIANPSTEEQDTLTKLSIDGITYSIQGSGGETYTAGYGIVITDDNEIEVDQDTIATIAYVDSSVTGLVAQSELEDAINEVESKIPTKTSDLENDRLFTDYDTVEEMIGEAVSSVYKYKGSVEYFSDLPETGNKNGDVYNVEKNDDDTPNGNNYAWVAASHEWDKLAGDIDLSNYFNKTEVLTMLNTKQNTLSTAQLAAADSTITATKVAAYDAYSTTKQDKLTAGENITIENNVISATGGGGGSSYTFTNGLTESEGTVSWTLNDNIKKYNNTLGLTINTNTNYPAKCNDATSINIGVNVTKNGVNSGAQLSYLIGHDNYASPVDSYIFGKRNEVNKSRGCMAIGYNNTVTSATSAYTSDDVGAIAIGDGNYVYSTSYTPVYAIGQGLIAWGDTNLCQVVIGRNNETDRNALFIVGASKSDGSRANALTLSKEGNLKCAGLTDGTTTKTMTEILSASGGGTTIYHHVVTLGGMNLPGDVVLSFDTSKRSTPFESVGQLSSEIARLQGRNNPLIAVVDNGVGIPCEPQAVAIIGDGTLGYWNPDEGDYQYFDTLYSDVVTEL